MEIEFFLSDAHVPYEDPAAFSVALKALRQVQPSIVWIGGDFVDCMAVSKYSKEPRRRLGLQDEFDKARERLKQMREAAPNSIFYFKEGNHEARLVKYLNAQAQELRYLRSLEMPALLDLKALDMEWVGNDDRYRIGKLWHIHGDEVKVGAQVNIARSVYFKMQTNVILGHFHRMQSYLHRDFDSGNPKGAFLNGCLCSLFVDYDYFPIWQQGFSLIHYSKSGYFFVEQIPIVHNEDRAFCVLHGSTLKAKKEKGSEEPCPLL